MLLMLFADGSAIPIAIGTGNWISSLVSEVFGVCKEEGERVDVFIIGYGFGIRH
jgi:hypothetical protein